jgi:hypothetical protein
MSAWHKTRKCPRRNFVGNMTVPIGQKPSGWSKIKHQSSLLLKKNPNAYFYRHTEPGVVCYARVLLKRLIAFSVSYDIGHACA